MNGIFKDYTETNRDRISNIVRRVDDLSLECRNITTDTTKVTINNNGTLIHGTREEEFFINKTNEFRRRLRNGETIDDILVEALAIVREAVRRRLNMFPYDTQIEAAVSMLGEKINDDYRERVIAEMKTGEGKTLVQILVAYINVLEATKDADKSKWSSVHIITSNDALAKRDKLGNESVFKLLGITNGFVPSRSATRTDNIAQRMINKQGKQKAYNCDIVYATATSIAFDYLEDNTIYDKKDRNINRKLGFAIVDEADDILIDQATNPLKLSQKPRIDGSEYDKYLIERENGTRALYKWATDFLYGKIRKAAMTGKTFNQEYDSRNSTFTEEYAYIEDTRKVILSGRIEKEIGKDLGDSKGDENLYNARYFALLNCIKAKEAFHQGVEYNIEQNGDRAKIVIIDQNTGRPKYSSKYTDGIQEAVEAKEEFLEQEIQGAGKRYHIEFSSASSIKAMCTYPDFLSVYEKNVCGMTGTSDEEEFRNLYGFETYRVRTRKRNIRIDEEPLVYATLVEKYNAIIEDIKLHAQKGQPILIGTTSLKESEIISSLLAKNFLRHQLLNANNEEEENQIVEGAGRFGTITVSTNMAGRGTDIKLGPGVRELGGLYVIGTSRNKSSRIDRQLMGRAGRQGDPGVTKYYSSLEDDLVREYYKGGALDGVVAHYKGSNKPIEDKGTKGITKTVLACQEARESKDKKIRMDNEKFNISFRDHRKIIYENRNKVLDSNIKEFMEMIKSIITKYVDILIKSYKIEEIEKLIGHLVPVNNLYDKNTPQFRVNIINALWDKFKGNFDVSKVTNKDIKVYVDNIKKKFLDIIDWYWLGHIEYLEDLKSVASFNVSSDPFRDFTQTSNETFANKLIPSLYNEMITYALNPTLRYGEYKINYLTDDEEEEKKVL